CARHDYGYSYPFLDYW
nr:immunoglobulin heavy chain junction region [Macaca mulatta]